MGKHLRWIHRILGQLRRDLDILQCSQVRDQIIKLKYESDIPPSVRRELFLVVIRNRCAIQLHLSFSQAIHTAKDIEQGGLTCPRLSYDDTDLTLPDLKGCIL